MISQDIDLVAGDFNGAAWRRRSRNSLSSIGGAFADCALPTPLGTTPLWGPGSIPFNWADVCGFFSSDGVEMWRFCNYVKLFLGSPTFQVLSFSLFLSLSLSFSLSFSVHRSRPFVLGTAGSARNVLRLGALSVSHTIVDHDSTNFLKTVSWCVV